MDGRQVELNTALAAMKPFMRDGVLLERVWPPAEVPGTWLSQIGGFPHLPPDWEWPRIHFGDGKAAALDFLAQVRLRDLPDIAERRLLPADGLLYFFALSQSAEPLSELGPQAWRVLHYAGDTSRLSRRPPPPDAGWNLDDLQTTRSTAADFRDPEAPKGELFPRCPVRPVAMRTWKKPFFQSVDDPLALPFRSISKSGNAFNDIEPFWRTSRRAALRLAEVLAIDDKAGTFGNAIIEPPGTGIRLMGLPVDPR